MSVQDSYLQASSHFLLINIARAKKKRAELWLASQRKPPTTEEKLVQQKLLSLNVLENQAKNQMAQLKEKEAQRLRKVESNYDFLIRSLIVDSWNSMSEEEKQDYIKKWGLGVQVHIEKPNNE